jgi:hypothetical protein
MSRDEMESELGRVREGIQRLIERRLLAPLADHEQALYWRLTSREDQLLARI